MNIERVLAPNAGMFTGPGTNTWLVDSEGSVVVIDPGPVDTSHADAIVAAIGSRQVKSVIVTHTHEDHAPLANPLARDLGAPALGYDRGPGFQPDERLVDGATFQFGTTEAVVVHTPGHSEDHLCFVVDRILFTGDHIMGGSSVMVDDMTSYMGSLDKVRRLDVQAMHPGHGDIISDPSTVIDWYIAHRLQRERDVVEAIAAGASSVADIVEVVYRDVDPGLHRLAARSVSAHVRKLERDGVVVGHGSRLQLAGVAG